MLAIFAKDLPVHTNLLAFLCLLYRVLQIEGEVTGDSVLVTYGSASGFGPSGDQIGQARGGVTQRGTATDTPRCSWLLRSGLLPSHPLEGGCWIGRLDIWLLVQRYTKGSRLGIY